MLRSWDQSEVRQRLWLEPLGFPAHLVQALGAVVTQGRHSAHHPHEAPRSQCTQCK